MTAKFVDTPSVGLALSKLLAGRETFGVKTVKDHLRLVRVEPDEAEIPPVRMVDPLKSIFFPPRQEVADYFERADEETPAKRAMIGVTACDLAALEVLDHVFLGGDFVDPFYQELRRNTLLISVDCTEPLDVCFCTFSGARPYPTAGFDLNLSPISGGYILEAGSEEGGSLLEEKLADLPEATADQFSERERSRAAVTQRVQQAVQDAGLPDPEKIYEKVQQKPDAPMWGELADQCVECGACNFVCPACHCFLLTDLEEEHGFRRFRNWDACLYPSFAKEASGANPRKRRSERLHGRMEKKFYFLKTDADRWGCVGCGRCIDACPGAIDVRETLRKLAHV